MGVSDSRRLQVSPSLTPFREVLLGACHVEKDPRRPLSSMAGALGTGPSFPAPAAEGSNFRSGWMGTGRRLGSVSTGRANPRPPLIYSQGKASCLHRERPFGGLTAIRLLSAMGIFRSSVADPLHDVVWRGVRRRLSRSSVPDPPPRGRLQGYATAQS